MKQNNFLCWMLTLLLLTVSLCGCQPVLETKTPKTEPVAMEEIPIASESLSSPSPTPTAEPTVSPTPTIHPEASQKPTPAPSETPLSSAMPEPLESTEPKKLPEELTCFLSVCCDKALQSEHLSGKKRSVLPADGTLLKIEKAVFYEGESVFHLLSRELKKHKIHFEYSKNPTFNSAYIEPISNLYEFDCGAQSGWIYKVNEKTSPVGCSQTILQPGDKIEFLYSCELAIGTN